jgi:two-component system response regulator YesN
MCNVLLAIPDADDRRFLKDIFTNHFFNVTFLPDVKHSDEAYRLTNIEQIDILILDLSSAAELTFKYKMKIMKIQPNVKVILLDDQQNADHLQIALRCGAIDYLVKPLQLEECKAAIHRAIVSLNQVSLLYINNANAGEEKRKNAHKMIQYIHQHFYLEDLSLERLANNVHLHSTYVSRTFSEIVGMPFTQYVQYYRIEQAKKKLRLTDLMVSEIAEQVGYSNITYFSRVFKKTTHYTPTQFRKVFEGKYVPADFKYVEQVLSKNKEII